jgi:hypothetical protein
MTRKILDFIKSPSGRFLLFFLTVVIFALGFNYYKNLPTEKKDTNKSYEDSVAIEREYVRFRDEYERLTDNGKKIKNELEHEVDAREKQNNGLEKRLDELAKALAEERARNVLLSIPPKKEVKKEKPKESFKISPVGLYTAKPQKPKETKQSLKDYAPYGRMLKCQLVNTVDSSNFETPLIALVTEDLWHDGKVVIPAGTEVHSKADSVTQRNRIATDGSWVLVWRTKSADNGFELALSGIALDYARDLKSGKHQITDGSAGLRGFTVETQEYSKLKLYAALFLKGAAEGVGELILEEAKSKDENVLVNSTQNTPPQEKSSESNQIKAGLAKGAQEAANLYAEDMMDAISRDGVFVRVPAGTSFYLYVTQTIDKSKAFPGAVGASGQRKVDVKDPQKEENELVEAQKIMLSLVRKRLEKEETLETEKMEKDQ